MALDIGQKQARRQQTPHGMLPADERLGAHHRAGAQVDPRLVEQHKFLVSQCLANAGLDDVANALAAVMRGIKQVVTVFGRSFCALHGLVSLAQHLVGIGIFCLGVVAHPRRTSASHTTAGYAKFCRWAHASPKCPRG